MFFSPTFAFLPALIGRFFIPELRDFVERDAQQTSLTKHLGKSLLHELALVRSQNRVRLECGPRRGIFLRVSLRISDRPAYRRWSSLATIS